MTDPNLLQKAQRLFELAAAKNIKIVSVESCTGGLLAALITQISGSSQIFERGFVTYSNRAKIEDLGVNEQILQQFGAVSKEAAEQMAKGAVANSQADLSIAITGIAGPNSDNSKKPVGLVYIASFNDLNKKLIVKKFNFDGCRQQIRLLSVENAINILISQIKQ
jgi:PncC family amidohydrolase